MNNSSPLRYPGGKTRACKKLDQLLSENFDLTEFDTVLSPFFGGGSFEFYLQNKYNFKLVVNDKFKPLYSFWQQIKLNKSELTERLYSIKSVDKQLFQQYKSTISGLNDNMLEQAIQYFILNRCSFSGSTLSGGFSEQASKKRCTVNSINKIVKLNFSSIDIYNHNFDLFINQYHTPKSILFLDPPYYLNSKLYGYDGDMQQKFDHILLFNTIKKYDNWMITYNNCDYIKQLYSEYTIIETDWSYSMNNSKKSNELVIINN